VINRGFLATQWGTIPLADTTNARGAIDATVRPAQATTIEPVPPATSVAPLVIPSSLRTYPIDLAAALRLAEAQNPTIAGVRTTVLEALALQQMARALLVPTLNAGTNYHDHTGNLQRSSGKILALREQSLYFGGGARTLAAESVGVPMVNIASPLTDAIYEPLAARQRVSATRFHVAATFNQVLGDVSVLYLDLLAAQRTLEAQRLSESQTIVIAQYTADYAATGEGRQADADRAQAEWKLRRSEVQDAESGLAIASARLAQRLNLDPALRLEPFAGTLVPIELIDLSYDQEGLIRIALGRRPELGSATAAVNQAEVRVRQEIGRPLLPTVWLGFSGGAFGGGSNLTPNNMGEFKDRTDFDARCWWTLANLGAGNAFLIKRRRAEVNQALAERARVMNRVRDEVSSARAEGMALHNQIFTAERELHTAAAGFEEDRLRARDNIGRPIEVLNSLNLLAEARVNLIRAITQYNQAQFRLWVALGSPPPLPSGDTGPVPPPPVNTPLHAPIADRFAPL
jgi:outer membrane protein TolC